MKKGIACLLLLCMICLSAGVYALDIKTLKLEVNDKNVEFTSQKPIQKSGRVLVPLKTVAESLGANVYWEKDGKKTITVIKEDIKLVFKIDNKRMLKQDKKASLTEFPVDMDVAPIVYKGSTMLPIRVIAENLNAEIFYYTSQNTLLVYTENQKSPFMTKGGFFIPNHVTQSSTGFKWEDLTTNEDTSTNYKFFIQIDTQASNLESLKRSMFYTLSKKYGESFGNEVLNYVSVKNDVNTGNKEEFKDIKFENTTLRVYSGLGQQFIKVEVLK